MVKSIFIYISVIYDYLYTLFFNIKKIYLIFLHVFNRMVIYTAFFLIQNNLSKHQQLTKLFDSYAYLLHNK